MLRNKQIFDIADKCDEGQEGNEFLVAFAYAIESAACAKRDARIAKLEQLRSEDLSHALDLAAEIERLARELAEARKDAERYRWLRDRNSHHLHRHAWISSVSVLKDGPCDIFSADEVPALLDAEVDRLMSATRAASKEQT